MLSKNFVIFFLLRLVGATTGLVLVSFQYNQTLQLKLYFHHFPSLLMLVYLIDFGYSEMLTKTGNNIAIGFIKRLMYVLLAIIILLIISQFFLLQNNYTTWLFLSIVFVPFQAYFDACYRVMLRNKLAIHYLLYQLLYPLTVLLLLNFFVSKIREENVFKLFTAATIFIQLFFLSIIYFLKPSIFNTLNQTEKNATKSMLIPFILKITPLLIYEIFTDVYVAFNSTNAALGLELIRSQYFVMGIVLLLFYANDASVIDRFKNNFAIIFLMLLSLSFCVALMIINVKTIIQQGFAMQQLKFFPFNVVDILFGLTSIFAASIYISQYSKWLHNFSSKIVNE